MQNPNLAADINKIIDTASTAAEASRSANRDVGNLGDSDDDDDDADAAEEKLLSNNYQQVSFTPRTSRNIEFSPGDLGLITG